MFSGINRRDSNPNNVDSVKSEHTKHVLRQKRR